MQISIVKTLLNRVKNTLLNTVKFILLNRVENSLLNGVNSQKHSKPPPVNTLRPVFKSKSLISYIISLLTLQILKVKQSKRKQQILLPHCVRRCRSSHSAWLT